MEKLKQVLQQEDTVLFIGSGVSLWAGLPTWSGMIEELAQFVERSGGKADLIRAEARRGELLQAASYGFDRLTKQQIGEFVRATCRYGSAKPHEIHKKIVTLGPRCFVTTNYDDLIEQSLRKWQPDRFYKPPVTNRHLTETAEIVHARATDFIFKPHGDAGDSESIVLTREQYRQLLPQGERQAALESVKMLLASRPVVYFGFGLRDPDFMYVRDLLANTYKGGTRDHYAVMADVSEAEVDYWRRNYGVHLLSYATSENPDKSKDHTSLLTLLDILLEKAPTVVTPPPFDPKSPEVLLSLARHASALARTPKSIPEFSFRVHTETKQSSGISYSFDKFDHLPVEAFLDSGPERAVLIGLPGAGKTYSLRRAAARLAEELNQACLAETVDQSAVVVPIIVDLKLYQGNLSHLASQTLPNSLPLDDLVRAYKVKVFIDSFNEMPREFWESGSYEADFQSFIKNLGQASVIIGSRTYDGLAKLDLPVYSLDQIDKETVTRELQRLGISIEGRFGDETRQLLQRPFYFQYIASGAISLPTAAHPRDFFRCFFANTNAAFAARFCNQLDFEHILSAVAYESLNRGEEAFPISELLLSLKNNLNASGIDGIQPRDIANWLVSRSVLLPYSGSRVAFVHQSITEYLAATELAKRYLTDPQTLKQKLELTRWDQALFLTLSLLPPEHADLFFRDVTKADLTLALNAAKYIEIGREKIISSLLSEVAKRNCGGNSPNWKLELAIEYGLPITSAHEPELRSLIQCGDSIGAVAIMRLVELKGAQIKDEILEMLLDKRSDYNFCADGVGRSLTPFASEQDAYTIATWADIVQNDESSGDEEYDDTGGFTEGASDFLADLDLDVIRRAFLPSEKTEPIPSVRGRIVCGVINRQSSTAALELAGEMLLRGVDEASMAISFIAENNDRGGDLSWDSFTDDHVVRLLDLAESTGNYFGLDALQCLCASRKDLALIVEQRASIRTGVAKAALLHCCSPADSSPIFDALMNLLTLSKEERQKEPLGLLKAINVDWAGKSELFVELLKICDVEVTRALLGDILPASPKNLRILEIGSIEWVLEWMLEVEKDDFDHWFLSQLSSLLASHLSREYRDLLIAEFDRPDSKYRKLLLHFIIPYFKDITTDAFNEDTISFLLADLNREANSHLLEGQILGNVATERFIAERLLPLLPEAKNPFAENLRAVLTRAGSRHGRRYGVE